MAKKKSSKKSMCEFNACRPLQSLTVTEDIVRDLLMSSQMAPVCFNAENWKFEFVYGDEKLKALKESLLEGNEWAHTASMIIAVLTEKEKGCVSQEKEYYLFDIGLATGFMVMRATDLGIILQPTDQFDKKIAQKVLGLDKDTDIITLMMVGRYMDNPVEELKTRLAGIREERGGNLLHP